MVEIFDHWQDVGLTVGERSDLLVLAENANDGTRLTFGPVHEPHILRRAGKTSNGWKNAIGKLVAKKVLTVHIPGRIKQAAVYHLEPLCPEARHDGYKGMCVRPSKEERVTSQVTQSEKEGHPADDPMGHPSGDPLGREGHPAGVERVTQQVTPTPPYPSSKNSSTTSSSVAELSVTEPAGSSEDGGGGGDLSSRFTAQEITTALDYRGKQPDKRQRALITDRLVAALDSGWSVDGLALYLELGAAAVDSPAAVYAHRLKPDVIPDAEPVPPQVRRGGARGVQPTAEEYESLTIDDLLGPARPATGVAAQWQEASRRAQDRLAGSGGTDSTVAGWAAVSRQLAAKEPHRPYNNDAWSAPAIAAEIATIPHCEDSVCDPTTRLRDYEGEDGLKYCSPCEKCHPRMRF